MELVGGPVLGLVGADRALVTVAGDQVEAPVDVALAVEIAAGLDAPVGLAVMGMTVRVVRATVMTGRRAGRSVMMIVLLVGLAVTVMTVRAAASVMGMTVRVVRATVMTGHRAAVSAMVMTGHVVRATVMTGHRVGRSVMMIVLRGRSASPAPRLSVAAGK